MLTYDKISGFISRFASFQKSLGDLRAKEFGERYALFSASFRHVKHMQREVARYNPESFNIFSILRLRRYEVRTHSALLASLLNPNGSHGQGTLFLRRFLSMPMVLGSPGEPEKMQGDWFAETEKATWLGNLDIFLYSRDPKRCVIIENKIDAVDQAGQLARYYKWLRSTDFSESQSRLIYLTVNGSNPSPQSMQYEDQEIALSQIALMSYRKDVTSWLRACTSEIGAPSVRHVIEQYIATIANL